MERSTFIASAAVVAALAGCSQPSPQRPEQQPPGGTRPVKPHRKGRAPFPRAKLAESTQLTPSIRFDASKASIDDAGLDSVPAIFAYDDASGDLTEIGTDVDSEIKALITPGQKSDIRVSMTPLYFTPSRTRFYVTGQNGHQHGIGKEYASLTLSFSQHAALPNLSEQLSWSNAWSLINNGTQDIPDAVLGTVDGKATFERMPVVDGQGVFGAEFQTGTTDNNFQRFLNSILTPLQGASSDPNNPLHVLGVPATALSTAISYLGAVANLVSDTTGGKPHISVDMKNANMRVVVHSKAFDVKGKNTLRIPGKDATYFLTPVKYIGDFNKTLALIRTKKWKIALDGTTSKISVIDPNNKNQPVTKTPQASDPEAQAIGPLDPYTILVIGTLVEDLGS